MSDFGLRIGIEGERDFKAARREINQSFVVGRVFGVSEGCVFLGG